MRISRSIAFISLIFFALPNKADGLRNSGAEWRAGSGARSVPIGAAAYIEGAWNEPIWGDWKSPENFSYGYFRPWTRWTTALTINSLDLGLSVYPVSFLGLTLGRNYDFRQKDSSASADCGLYKCDGKIQADYGNANLILGAAGFFLSSELDLRDHRPDSAEQDFYEEGNALVGRRGYDRIFSQTHTLGMKLSKGWFNGFIGIGGRRSEAHLSGNYSQRFSLVAGHEQGPWRYVFALGPHESTLLAKSLAIGLQVEWIGRSGMQVN